MSKQVGPLAAKVTKVDLIYFAGFICTLEDRYRHKHMYTIIYILIICIYSSFVLKIGYGLGLLLWYLSTARKIYSEASQ